jgi:hypothetical protein
MPEAPHRRPQDRRALEALFAGVAASVLLAVGTGAHEPVVAAIVMLAAAVAVA